jgi:predicted amidophosphoribosyltransferase
MVERPLHDGIVPVIGRCFAGLAATEPNALLVPMPLHRRRIWRRGFNQSAMLARQIARRTGIELHADPVERPRPVLMLGWLGRMARARLARHLFRPI